jgi:hypothetical protein
MPAASFQTVKLERGKHLSPDHGVCVMELASMIAGEPFCDHPRSVSAPIAAFLRFYNDRVGDRQRADLYEYAARAVGSVGPPELESQRIERLLAWGDAALERQSWLGLGTLLRRRRARAHRKHGVHAAARYAILALPRIDAEIHLSVLRLVDELLPLPHREGATTPGTLSVCENSGGWRSARLPSSTT